MADPILSSRPPVGHRFGRWTVTGEPFLGDHFSYYCACRCDCGTEKIVKIGSLTSGRSCSCGCLNLTPAMKHGGAGTFAYSSWKRMRNRCLNPANRCFPDYGGRGITICPEWADDFPRFLLDMGPRPSKAHSIDRIDNNGNYEPGNCRWATAKEQQNNKRANRRLEFQGRRLTVAQWSRELGFRHDVIPGRLRRGWSVEEALTAPLGTWRKRAQGVSSTYPGPDHDATKEHRMAEPIVSPVADDKLFRVPCALAARIGLNEAIFVQRLHELLRTGDLHRRNGHLWVAKGEHEWAAEFPFWPSSFTARLIYSLEVPVKGGPTARPALVLKWISLDPPGVFLRLAYSQINGLLPDSEGI